MVIFDQNREKMAKNEFMDIRKMPFWVKNRYIILKLFNASCKE